MKQVRKYLVFAVMLNSLLSPVSWGERSASTMEADERMLIDFSSADEKENWRIINDDVMGGISQSEIVFGETGTAIFRGRISLENNGGFASTRSKPRSFELLGYTGLVMRIRGDGKDYQLRLKADDRFDGISYRYHFATQQETWQTIRVPFSDFVPVFRGRVLRDVKPVSPEQVQQIGFLIADKQAGKFRIQIDWIKAYK